MFVPATAVEDTPGTVLLAYTASVAMAVLNPCEAAVPAEVIIVLDIAWSMEVLEFW